MSNFSDIQLNLRGDPDANRSKSKLNLDYSKSSRMKVEKQRMKIIKKINELRITNHAHKEILKKMAMTQEILDIVKVLKSSESSVTLHAKINTGLNKFSKCDSDDVVIKVLLGNNTFFSNMLAYSRNLASEKKIIDCDDDPCSMRINANQDFCNESMIIERNKNVIIFKRFGKII
jgi:hypothetical protein